MKNNSMAVGAIALLVGLAVGYFALSGQKEIAEVEKVVEVEAKAETNPVNIRVQAVIGMQTTEVKMLKDFMADVTKLTDGEVTLSERIWMTKLCDSDEYAKSIVGSMLGSDFIDDIL